VIASLTVAAPRPADATSTSGTDFWVAFFRNIDAPVSLDLFITGATSTSGTVSGAPLDEAIPFTVTAGTVTTVTLPVTAQVTSSTTGAVLDLGIRITAAAPVTDYGINLQTFTTDGFLAIPVEALGTRYRVATLNGGYLAVVATRDGTVVSVDGTEVGTLSAGQVYYSEPGGNPTGKLVTANHPISVFAGHPCSNEPGGACDHLVEQLPPTDTWGSDFVAMRYADESNATQLARLHGGAHGLVHAEAVDARH
jgi:hypothetical protein